MPKTITVTIPDRHANWLEVYTKEAKITTDEAARAAIEIALWVYDLEKRGSVLLAEGRTGMHRTIWFGEEPT